MGKGLVVANVESVPRTFFVIAYVLLENLGDPRRVFEVDFEFRIDRVGFGQDVF